MRSVLLLPGFLLLGFFVFSLSACGGPDSATGGAPGSVAILFTDAPTDEFSEINVTIRRIVLLGDNDAVTEIFFGEKTLNLLDLEHHADMLSITGNVPAGQYSKVRLIVSDVKLVRKDPHGGILAVVTPRLPGNGKIDLNPRGTFDVIAGQTLMLEIDFDARKSIHYHATGNGGYVLRPVIFIKQLTPAAAGKLVRLSGEVAELDGQSQTFRLCRTPIVHRENRLDSQGAVASHVDLDDTAKWCPLVQITADTALFNADGEPMAFGGISATDRVTVLGRFDPAERRADKPALIALTVLGGAPGTFGKYSGEVTAALDPATSQFGIRAADGPGITGPVDLNVQIQDGTVVVSRHGDRLDASALAVGRMVKVLGVPAPAGSAPGPVRAAVIFVDMDAAALKLGGAISAIDPSRASFILIADTAGDRCVRLTDTTGIFLVQDTAGSFSSRQVMPAALAIGQTADVYGRYDLGGCLVANTVLAAGG